MYQQYNPFLQPYRPQQRGMDNYMQDAQFSPAFQNMSPEMQQQAMARHQFDLQNYMQQRQQQGMEQNPFAGLSQQQQEMLGQFGYPQQPPQQSERVFPGVGGIDYNDPNRGGLVDPESLIMNNPNMDANQRAEAIAAHREMAGSSLGPQQPPVQDGFTTLVEAARRRQGIPEPQPGPQQPNPQFGARQGGFSGGPWGAGGPSQMLRGPSGTGQPMNPAGRQPAQHWTPPSVNMPIHQRNQPWMGGQSQLAAQYGGQNFGAQREYQGNPFARQGRRGGSTNPFQRRGSQPTQNLGVREMRTEPRKPTTTPSPTTPPSGGSRGRGSSGLAPTPMPGANPFDRISQQRQQPVIPSFNSR
jgi:hypothetical protein